MAVVREKTGEQKPKATAHAARNGKPSPEPAPELRPVLLAPVRVRRSLRRRLHLGALVAALLYGGAAYGAYTLVSPHVRDAPAPRVGAVAQAGAAAPALATATPETLAMRALAARAQRGVYLVEGAGGSIGSGFVAWVQPGQNRSFLITARAVVAGLLAEGGRTVWVKRGNRLWNGRLVRADKDAALALIRVGTVLDKPLWQARGDAEPLESGSSAYLVPAGPDTPFGEAAVGSAPNGRLALRTGSAALNLGAPVLTDSGRIGGVVVATSPNGVNTVVPIGAACGKIRRCR